MLFFGKNLSIKKNISYSLKSIFGIGGFYSHQICKNIGINPSIGINSLNKNQLNKLFKFIDKNIKVDVDLKKEKKKKTEYLLNIKTYRGIRNFQGLPVNGQRTRSNSKTKKKFKIFITNNKKKW